MKVIRTVVGFVAISVFAVVPSFADSATYSLNYSNLGWSGGPFGSVIVTDTVSNTVQVTVNLNSGLQFVNAGFQGTFDFDLQGTPNISVTIDPGSASLGWSLISSTAAVASDPNDPLKFDG